MKRSIATLTLTLTLIQLVACGGMEGIDQQLAEVRTPKAAFLNTPSFYAVEVDLQALETNPSQREPRDSIVLDAGALQVALEGGRVVAYLDTHRVVGPALVAEQPHTLRIEVDKTSPATRLYLNGKRIAELAAAANLPASMQLANDGSGELTPRAPRPPVAMGEELGGEAPREVNTPKPPTAGNVGHAIVDLDSDPAGSLVNPPTPPVAQGAGSVALEGEDAFTGKPRPPVNVTALRLQWQDEKEAAQQMSWSVAQ